MSTYCYNCGQIIENARYCGKCGTDTQPHRDVFFVEEDCGDCNAPLPRWANFCPKCGKQFGFIEPTDKRLVAKRNKGLTIAGIIFSVVGLVIAITLSLAEKAIPLQYSLIGAVIFIIFIWLVTIIRWERGKFKDGSVVRHYSENRIRSEKDLNNTTITGKAGRRNISFTLYSTEVRFDDGSIETFNIETAANHIQLKIGDRVRYYLSTRSYRKI